MVVAVVTDLNLLKTQLVQDPIPSLLGDDGRGFHDSPVGDDEQSTFWVDFSAIKKYMSSKLKINTFIYMYFLYGHFNAPLDITAPAQS